MSTKLTVFLIKQEYQNSQSVLKEDLEYSEHRIKPQFNIDGRIFIGPNPGNTPYWLELLQSGSTRRLPRLNNSSSRAVLFIRYENRIFAFVFGFGRFMLKEECIVRDFGIKVVINSVVPSKLRSIDTSTFDEMTVHSRTQTSRNANVSSFGIDIVRDLLKAVTGEPTDNRFGSNISGREAVQFSYALDSFSDFQVICDYLFQRYISTDYRDNFEWFDNLNMVNDPTMVSQLNESLLTIINNRTHDGFHLAPPEIIDWGSIIGFSFTRHGRITTDILVSDYYNYLGNQQITFEQLKRHCIYVHYLNAEPDKWSLYNSIVFEAPFGQDTYMLTIGQWFKINNDFAQQVTDYIEAIPDTNILLPPCRHNENEGMYNIRVGSGNNNLINLDRNLIYFDGNQIELCDLISNNGSLIHIKNWRSSSTLSHLFAQGRISASCLVQDISFRRSARGLIEDVNPSLINIIGEDNYDPSNNEIVYAIIYSGQSPIHQRLPFFSKLNMMQATKLLTTMRFHVTKCHISLI